LFVRQPLLCDEATGNVASEGVAGGVGKVASEVIGVEVAYVHHGCAVGAAAGMLRRARPVAYAACGKTGQKLADITGCSLIEVKFMLQDISFSWKYFAGNWKAYNFALAFKGERLRKASGH